MAEVLNAHHKRFAWWSWNPADNTDTLGALVNRWLFPVPVAQPIIHNGDVIGEIRLTARDSLISHFIWLSFAVLTGCILFASAVALTITRSLHHGMVVEMQNITDVVHDVRTNRNFSRRVTEGRIEEFHQFGEDFNSLLDEDGRVAAQTTGEKRSTVAYRHARSAHGACKPRRVSQQHCSINE
ncbi:CHASE sensor domain-containing protein [Enterobacter hormaechei]